jgi:hypothetical protein
MPNSVRVRPEHFILNAIVREHFFVRENRWAERLSLFAHSLAAPRITSLLKNVLVWGRKKGPRATKANLQRRISL